MLSERILTRLGIPKNHWNANLDYIPDKVYWKTIFKTYISNLVENIKKPKGLYVNGPFGSGKSAVGAILLKEAFARGKTGYWINARSIPKHEIEKTTFDTQFTVYERACFVDLLVIDELLIYPEIKATELYMEFLIRKRVEEKKCTIITSNHTIQDLRNMMPSMFAPLVESVVNFPIGDHNFRIEIGRHL